MINPHDYSDLEYAALVLQEQLDCLTDTNSPTAHKLRLAIHKLIFLDEREKAKPKNYWFLQYLGDEGQHVSPDDLIPEERKRIANMVVRGFTAGEILPDAYDYEEEAAQ